MVQSLAEGSSHCRVTEARFWYDFVSPILIEFGLLSRFLLPALGGLLYGYEIGATSCATISLQSPSLSGISWYNLSSLDVGLVTSGSLYGGLVGSAVTFSTAGVLLVEEKEDYPPSSDKIDGREIETVWACETTMYQDEVRGGEVGSSSSTLPRRLFAAHFYPTALRLNIYSKAYVIGAVASSLRGSAAMENLLKSQFGKLFQLPDARCHNSTKLVGSLLCRQLVMIRKFEMWFNWLELQSIRLGHVLEMLRNPYLAEWKRVPLALIALVDGVVCCGNKSLKLNPKYVEMLCDLFAFEAVPMLLAKIPDASRTATFLDDPTACANTVTILTVQDIVFVETDPALSVNFTQIPEEKRHLLLEEVQKNQVTSLVEMMRSGETFKIEDFPDGDTSFWRNLEKKNTGRLPKDEKCDSVPETSEICGHVNLCLLILKNHLRHSEPPGHPHSGRCTHEDLKPWMLVHFENYRTRLMKLGEIYAGVWVAQGNPAANPVMIIIDSLPLLQVLDSKTSGQPGRWKRHSYSLLIKDIPIRCTVDMATTSRDNATSEQRETGEENESDKARFHAGNSYTHSAEDAQQQETPSTAVVLYEDVLCAQPQSYVSPPKNTATRHFVDQIGSPVKWGESNPHLYSTEKNQNPYVGHDSGQTSNLEVPNTGEKLAKVPSHIVEDCGQDPPIVEETNPEFLVMEEEERYDSFREDICTDTQMHEK
ncbi:hypothetical protein Bca4012_058448 [Brassica carinata]